IPDDRELQHLESSPSAPAWAYGRWIIFSPDGRFIAKLEDNGRLRLWRCENGESVLSNPPEQCCAVTFSPDSRQIAVGQESSIVCFDLATGQERRRWQALTQP